MLKLTGFTMPQPQKTNVIIANDRALVREGLATILKQYKEIEVVAKVSQISEVMDILQRRRSHVLVLDIVMNGSNVVDSILTIRQRFPMVAILMVSSQDGSEDIHRALRAGARGYVLTDVTNAELIEAIHNVTDGRRYISRQVAERLAERMSGSTLTPRELDVLQLIVRGKSNKEIAANLNLAEETVKYHVKGILGKLGVADRTQAATTALLRGIVHRHEL
jgi:DNA-binding NarL/FixJ family response regulator